MIESGGVHSLSMDKPREKCGIIGAVSRAGDFAAGELLYRGLLALQHRGQESAGIATYRNGMMNVKRGDGLLMNIFKPVDFTSLDGNAGVGHVRYSTTGSGYFQNVQPILARFWGGMMAVSHNGNIVNSREVRDRLIDRGALIRSSSDTEVLLHLIATQKPRGIRAAILGALREVSGAYSIVMIVGDKLIAVRDPYGWRPLCIGKIYKGYVIASESTALDIVGAEFLRDVRPGEIIETDGGKLVSHSFRTCERNAPCVFEYIYFARADSVIDGIGVYEVRKRLGRELARMNRIDADVVVPVPDSGISTAIGFSQESGIPFDIGLFKNSYVGRTFIDPGKSERGSKVKIKLNPIRSTIEGKRVAVIDDSIVRGTTSKRIIRMIRDAGAKEIHLFISSPPITHPCFFGIDTSEKKTLIASTQTVEDIRKFLQVDSLTYMSIEGLSRAVGRTLDDLCYACFNGDYPVPVVEDIENGKMLLEDYRVNEM
jgi:amidophosphoribosyltransferase